MADFRRIGRRLKNAFKSRLVAEEMRVMMRDYLSQNYFDFRAGFELFDFHRYDRPDFIVSSKGYEIPVRLDDHFPFTSDVCHLSHGCRRYGRHNIAKIALIYAGRKVREDDPFVLSCSREDGVEFFRVNRSNFVETLESVLQNPKPFFEEGYVEKERMKLDVKEALFGGCELFGVSSSLEEFKKRAKPLDYKEVVGFAVGVLMDGIKYCCYGVEEKVTRLEAAIERAGKLGMDAPVLGALEAGFFGKFFDSRSQLLPARMKKLGEKDHERYLKISKFLEKNFRKRIRKMTVFLEMESLASYARECGLAPDEVVKGRIDSMVQGHRDCIRELKKFRGNFE